MEESEESKTETDPEDEKRAAVTVVEVEQPAVHHPSGKRRRRIGETVVRVHNTRP